MSEVDEAQRKEKALEILYQKRVPLGEMMDVRECVLSGNPNQGISVMVEQYGFTQGEAETVMRYFDPAMKGRPVRFEEISPSEIHFPSMDECVDEEDWGPLKLNIQYFARRGLVIDELATMSTIGEDGRQIDMVSLGLERMEPSKLDQVWRVVANT